MEDTLDHSAGNLSLSAQAQDSLYTTARWAKFIAIVGFVMIGLMVIIGIFMGIFTSAFPSTMSGDDDLGMGFGPMSGFVFLIYILIAFLYIYPTYNLYKFSTNAMSAIKNQNGSLLETSMSKLKACFKFIGIITAIIIGIYVLMFVIGLGFGLMGG